MHLPADDPFDIADDGIMGIQAAPVFLPSFRRAFYPSRTERISREKIFLRTAAEQA